MFKKKKHNYILRIVNSTSYNICGIIVFISMMDKKRWDVYLH